MITNTQNGGCPIFYHVCVLLTFNIEVFTARLDEIKTRLTKEMRAGQNRLAEEMNGIKTGQK